MRNAEIRKRLVTNDEKPFLFFNRNGETGEMESAGQDVLLKLDNFVKKADQIIAKRKNSGKSDVPLESILSMAGWKTRTELQSAAEFFRFDSKNGIPPCMTSSNAHQESDKTAKNVVVTDAMGYSSMLDNLVSRFRNKVRLFIICLSKVQTIIDSRISDNVNGQT